MHESIWNRAECQVALDEVLLKTALSSLLEIEGKKLLVENEILKNDPRFQLSPEIDKKIQRALRGSEIKKKFRVVGKKAGNLVSKVAVIFLAVFIGLTSTMVVSADFRRVIYNLILSYDERYTQMEANTKYSEFIDSDAYAWEHTFAPTVIPSGYVLVSIENHPTIYQARYEKSDYLYLEFSQMSGNGKTRVDTENAQIVQNILIGDSKALMVEKDGVKMITWQTGDFLLHIESNDQTNTIIDVANNIKLMR